MEDNQIISGIEELIDKLPYTSASLTIVMDEKTVTIEKIKRPKKNPIGFSE